MIALDRVKACSKATCREVLPADPDDELGAGFWVKQREAGPGSRVLKWQSQCKECVKRACRERARVRRAREGKQFRERQRAAVRTLERDGRIVLLRVCLGPCGRELECGGPGSAFAVKERDERGRAASYHSWCRECDRVRAKEWRDAHRDEVNARRREVYARRMLEDPEFREAKRAEARRAYRESERRRQQVREANRRWSRRMRKLNPEVVRERDRLAYRLRAERRGRKVRERGSTVIDGTRPERPARPFVEWLAVYKRARGLSAPELALELGLVERRARSLLAGGQASVSVDVVSRALTEARVVVSVCGRTVVTFDDLYPGEPPLRERRRPRGPATVEEYQAKRRARRAA